MLHSPTDAAHRTHANHDFSGGQEITLRSFIESDFPDVRRLFHEGVLTDTVNPPDPATDAPFLQRRFLSRPQDHLWVAEAQGKVVATIGLTEDEDRIGHVRRMRVERQWLEWHNGNVARILIAKAADHAREHEMLKLVLHTPLNDERAIAFLHQIGFEFARIRDRAGMHLLEFYQNIYDDPTLRTPHKA